MEGTESKQNVSYSPLGGRDGAERAAIIVIILFLLSFGPRACQHGLRASNGTTDLPSTQEPKLHPLAEGGGGTPETHRWREQAPQLPPHPSPPLLVVVVVVVAAAREAVMVVGEGAEHRTCCSIPAGGTPESLASGPGAPTARCSRPRDGTTAPSAG